MHFLQPLHLSGFILSGFFGFTYFNSTQGLREIITDGSFFSSSSFTTLSHSSRLYGSTTLTEFIPKEERLITIEDSAELQVIGMDNLIRLEARNANVEGKNMITIRDLIKCSLRMRPDRIVVGEVRDAAAIDMLQAMNTGHDGSISTGHANSAHEMLMRLEAMVLMGTDLPLKAVRGQIASAIDIVIHLGRLRDRSRKVLEIREVVGLEDEEIITRELWRFEEKEGSSEKVVGDFRKINDLLNVRKLKDAGLLSVYRERYMQ